MHTDHAQPHYTPSSVGALMDPAFLRSAMLDASGERRLPRAARASLSSRWQSAVHAVAAALRRH